ncbi:MAG: glycoside hydrolase family 3 C-terminal domain-containing protein [Limisphaerales bacterium]
MSLVPEIKHCAFLLFTMTILKTAQAREHPLYIDNTKPVGARVEDLLSRLTLEEKVSLVHANTHFSTAGVPRLGIPDLTMDDGPLGVREEVGEHGVILNHKDDFATAMPGTLGLAATWNPDLAVAFGSVIGQEARQRGKDIMLGPAMNIQRTPLCGRNFEYTGEDPFLASRIAVNYIKGEQAQGVSSCAKHYAANSQEYQRRSINEIIDERTLREIYLPAFRASVQEAGVLTVMGAYNQVNGQFCCENEHLLNGILKGEWGFKGFVVSDWGGVHHTDLAVRNGLDIEMGSDRDYDKYYLAEPFLKGLKSGKYPVSMLDEMVRRHLYVMFQLNLIHDPAAPPATNAAPSTELSTPAHQEIARKIAEESFVLLKNEKSLPLNPGQIKTIAVIGANAVARFAHGGGSARIKSPYEITALEGISNYLGGKVKIIYAQGYNPPVGSGRPDYRPDGGEEVVSPVVPESKLIAEAVAAAKAADVVIYVGGLNHKGGYDTEGADRKDLKLPAGQDKLIQEVVQANPKTVVVLYGGGAVEMDAWLSQVPALLYVWYPGIEGGNALARVLFGDVNPSGKLPCTFPKRLADSPAHALEAYPGKKGTVKYKEGLLVGYRWYDTRDITPLFPFGYGLSYTQFKYSDLNPVPGQNASRLPVTVEFELANTGDRAGAEVAQVYVQEVSPSVPRPLKELKGFKKVSLQPGEKQKVSIALDRSAFAHYDPDKKGWVADRGAYKILVASSSRDIQLTGEFKLEETTVALDSPEQNAQPTFAALK